MLTSETRDSVIIGLYDAVLDPSQTLSAIERLNSWLDCDGIHIIGWSRQRQGFTVNLASQQLAHTTTGYPNHYRQFAPRWVQASRLNVGQFLSCHDACDDRLVDRNGFFQDLFIPGGNHYTMAGVIFRDDDEEIVIAIYHVLSRDKFDADKRRAFTQLAPYLNSWLRQLRHTDTLRCAVRAGETGLEGMEQGVVLLDAERRILYQNKLAARFFPSHPGREYGQQVLVETRQIDDAIRRVQQQRQPENLQTTLRQHPQLTCIINILPVAQTGYSHSELPPGASHAAGLTTQAGSRYSQGLNRLPRGDVILLLRSKHRQTAASAATLTELFDLTGTECRLARALAQGASAESYAQAYGLSINTVRTQIRALLAKTGEDNLQGLQRLLALLPGF